LKSIYALSIIIVVSWVLIIGESYVFFAVIRPLGPPLGLGLKLGYISSILKIVGTAALALGWNGVMLGLWGAYLRSHRSEKTRSAAS
jgi:hypothetical protein